MFSVQYVIDCVHHNRLLPDLDSYKMRSRGFFSSLEAYNPLEVLLGLRAWGDIPRRVEGRGERVDTMTLSQGMQVTHHVITLPSTTLTNTNVVVIPTTTTLQDPEGEEVNPVKLGWTPYSRKESLEIVAYVQQRGAYSNVGSLNTLHHTYIPQLWLFITPPLGTFLRCTVHYTVLGALEVY